MERNNDETNSEWKYGRLALTARKTTTRTHEGRRLLGVHIGVHQP